MVEVSVAGARASNLNEGEQVHRRCRCFESPVFTRVLFNSYFLSVVSCMSFGVGLWMSSLPSTGLSFLELGSLYFLGDAAASLCGIAFGTIKSFVQAQPIKMKVQRNDWRVYMTAIVFPLLSVGASTCLGEYLVAVSLIRMLRPYVDCSRPCAFRCPARWILRLHALH